MDRVIRHNRENMIAESPKTSENNKPNVIATIPCFNTEKYISDIVSEARTYVDCVIAIDDGSSDNTAKLAKDSGAFVVNHVTNRGYGEAIKSCFKMANASDADILVTLDGDGQHNPSEISSFITPIIHGEADLTIGSRFCVKDNGIPRYRQIGIRVITWLFNVGSKSKVSDSQSGFRAYNKKVFNTLYPGFPISNRGYRQVSMIR